MFVNYLKIAIKVLLRRKFFTVVSLFGISFTLVVLMVATAVLDHVIAPLPPEVHQDRTVTITRASMDHIHSANKPGGQSPCTRTFSQTRRRTSAASEPVFRLAQDAGNYIPRRAVKPPKP